MSVIPTKPLGNKSNIGGFLWWGEDGKIKSRTFYQTASGTIRAIADGNDIADAVPGAGGKPIAPMIGTPLSSVYFEYNGFQSRTFFLNTSNQVCCFSMNNKVPSYDVLSDPNGSPFTAQPDSKLASFMWIPSSGAPHIRLTFQRSDNTAQQINHDDTPGVNENKPFIFTMGNVYPAMLQGTGLAFLNQGPKKDVDQYSRGYYQRDSQIMELVSEPSSSSGSFTQQVQGKSKIRASYPAVSKGQDFGRKQGPVYVYWTNPDGTVSRRIRDNSGSWGIAFTLPASIRVTEGGFLPLAYCPNGAQSPVKERIYWNAGNGEMKMQDL